ncbi:ATP-binding protein [Salmonella enterica]|nr:ATP-binding protein [Salmonella enterica]
MRECDPAGAPGVEKTHLAAAPGVKAADVGHRVLFMPQDRLVDADESEAGKPPGAPATTTELCAGG